MKLITSPFLLATLSSALLTPRLTQGVVLIGTTLLAALAALVLIDPALSVGMVEKVWHKPGAEVAAPPSLIAVRSAFGLEAFRLPMDAPPVQLGDLVLADGQNRSVADIGDFLDVRRVTVLPVAQTTGDLWAAWAERPFDRVHPAVWVLGAVLLVLAAPLILRAVPSLVAGLGVTGLVAGLWHLNLRYQIVPLPLAVFDDLIFAAAIFGTVAGWKAMAGDERRIGHRVGALLIALALLQMMAPVQPSLPVHLAVVFLGLVAIWPVLAPIALGMTLVSHVSEPAALAFVGMAIVFSLLRVWLGQGPVKPLARKTTLTKSNQNSEVA